MRTACGLLGLAYCAAAFHCPARRITAVTRTAPARRAPAPVAAAPARPPTALSAGSDDEEKRLPWFFDPGTYGGVIVLTIFLIVAPLALKEALEASGMDGNQVGVALSGVFVIGGSLLWAFSYVFRVFSKDMTYSTQLKQYEDAVIQKRFEELEDDEVDALLGEIERESAL
mmetsp:Transcript_5292/g.13273  ORF Transcript_5292/g.13273 Transcript_5292/m.13273 type:complete len:171 (-) Transcript_5292:24-536(-)